MGFFPPDALVHVAQRRGIEVRPPDVNASAVLCRVEEGTEGLAVRIGLGYVKGLSERDAAAVVAERERGGDYRDLGDLASRSGAGRDGGREISDLDAVLPVAHSFGRRGR